MVQVRTRVWSGLSFERFFFFFVLDPRDSIFIRIVYASIKKVLNSMYQFWFVCMIENKFSSNFSWISLTFLFARSFIGRCYVSKVMYCHRPISFHCTTMNDVLEFGLQIPWIIQKAQRKNFVFFRHSANIFGSALRKTFMFFHGWRKKKRTKWNGMGWDVWYVCINKDTGRSKKKKNKIDSRKPTTFAWMRKTTPKKLSHKHTQSKQLSKNRKWLKSFKLETLPCVLSFDTIQYNFVECRILHTILCLIKCFFFVFAVVVAFYTHTQLPIGRSIALYCACT